MSIDLEHLKAIAEAAGGEEWSNDGEIVWFGNGESAMVVGNAALVGITHSNLGHWPEAIMSEDVAEFVASANPAVMLELVALLKDRTSDIVQYETQLAAARAQQQAALAHSEQAEQIMDDLRGQLSRAAALVRGLTAERNALIVEKNNALMRAIKAEDPPLGGALRPQVDLFRIDLPALPMPNDRLDDVLPLPGECSMMAEFIGTMHKQVAEIMGIPSRLLIINLPASMDLPDSEGDVSA